MGRACLVGLLLAFVLVAAGCGAKEEPQTREGNPFERFKAIRGGGVPKVNGRPVTATHR
jgi:hypothetical protein